MKLHSRSLFRQAVWSLLTVAAVMPLRAATIDPFGGPLEGPIVAGTVPPTRAENPVLATARQVVQWDDASQAWVPLYSPPWTTARIRALGSYAKSSKVLYVVHGAGVSRTGDGGETWSEAVPAGFNGDADMFLVRIDPIERKHAVVVSDAAAWETTDYGATFLPLPVDPALGPIIGMQFLAGQSGASRLVLSQRGGLTVFGGSPLRVDGKVATESMIASCLFHPTEPLLYLRDRAGKWQLLELPEGEVAAIRPLAGSVSNALTLPLSSGSSSVWSVDQASLRLVSLEDPTLAPFTVGDLPGTAEAVFLHPRQPDALYVVSGNQLYKVSDSFAGASAQFIAPASLAGLRPLDWQREAMAEEEAESPELAAREEQPMDVAILLNKLLADEPTFQKTVFMVLENEQASPGQFAEWMQDVRKRHWLPELKLIGGVRELGVTDNLLVSSTDPFGFETLEDYRLPDRIQNLAYFGVVLQWPLEDLFFDDQMVDISKERRYYFKERRAMIEDVAQIYYGRLNKIVEAKGLMGPPTRAHMVMLLLEIHQMSEVLNAICGQPLFDPTPIK